MLQYRQVETRSADELAAVVPGGRFWLSPLAGGRFGGGHKYLDLAGLVLNHVMLGGSCFAVGKRERASTVCSVIGPRAAMNGRGIDDNELTLVHSGDPLSLSTAGAATLHSFTLEPQLCAEFPELELPFGFSSSRRPGRWKAASTASVHGFVGLLDSMFAQLAVRPTILDGPAAKVAMRNAALEKVCRLSDNGEFEPDASTAGRHTRIILLFQRALEETEPEHLDMLTLCRASGTSRRSLEAIFRRRTGKSPWDYVRWRRLLRARDRLSSPDATTRVTRVAADLGIWHLGRFAREYAVAFGESPAETLFRTRGGKLLREVVRH